MFHIFKENAVSNIEKAKKKEASSSFGRGRRARRMNGEETEFSFVCSKDANFFMTVADEFCGQNEDGLATLAWGEEFEGTADFGSFLVKVKGKLEDPGDQYEPPTVYIQTVVVGKA